MPGRKGGGPSHRDLNTAQPAGPPGEHEPTRLGWEGERQGSRLLRPQPPTTAQGTSTPGTHTGSHSKLQNRTRMATAYCAK